MLAFTADATLPQNRLYIVALAALLAACGQQHDPAPAPAPAPALAPAPSASAAPVPIPPSTPSVTVHPLAPSGNLAPMPQAAGLSTSTASTEPAAVWGGVIGGNVGAAQSCGVADARLRAYIEAASVQTAAAGLSGAGRHAYKDAYEQARSRAASLPRDAETCRQILDSLAQ